MVVNTVNQNIFWKFGLFWNLFVFMQTVHNGDI
jgi:hypothetical protein